MSEKKPEDIYQTLLTTAYQILKEISHRKRELLKAFAEVDLAHCYVYGRNFDDYNNLQTNLELIVSPAPFTHKIKAKEYVQKHLTVHYRDDPEVTSAVNEALNELVPDTTES